MDIKHRGILLMAFKRHRDKVESSMIMHSIMSPGSVHNSIKTPLIMFGRLWIGLYDWLLFLQTFVSGVSACE